jgi:hypothetical protein
MSRVVPLLDGGGGGSVAETTGKGPVSSLVLM